MTATPIPIPDPSSLVGLEPGVAYAFCALFGLVVLLYYFGEGLRDRIFGSSRPAAQADPPPTVPQPPALTPALDRDNEMADRYIASLERQVVDGERTIAARDRELERLRMDIDRLRDQQQWRRGTS